ncbi:MAG: protein-glutamate O-methyltransferase CheR [Methanomicrobia archaeon]|nr:protein-glutamate O-methyltransferase CheR [Methanomicrobia archaeon]
MVIQSNKKLYYKFLSIVVKNIATFNRFLYQFQLLILYSRFCTLYRVETMVVNNELAFNTLKKKIWDRTGVDCSSYKDNYLKRRIDVRMKSKGFGTSYDDYTKFLEKNPDEYKALLNDITINVTEFFRDSETFNAFRNEVLPQVLSDKRNRKSKILRIWSAGCSIGEEPYTIGIILHEKLGLELNDYLVSIHATDIDENALKAARAGVYDAQALKNINKYQIPKYFDSDGNGKYHIKDKVKHLVRFNQHDLISGKKFSHFDIIFCRNVMIYFEKDFQSRLLLTFYNALNVGGYLILGRTETMPGAVRDQFLCVNTRERIYKKQMM